MKNFTKYTITFLITCGIFGAAWYLSSYLNNKKINEIKTIQNQVALDIMSSETQYSLLEELSCTDLNNSLLTQEIGDLADKITYAENNVNAQSELKLLKEQYTILEVKDFLLSKQIGDRCHKKPTTILYFYGKADSCQDCVKEGYVLDALREQYPDLRVYSFDYNLDSATIKALNSIYKTTDVLPALVVNSKTISGFQSVDQLTALLSKDFILQEKKTTASSTK